MANVTIKDYQDWLKNNSKVKVPKEGEELSAYDELENRRLYQQYVDGEQALKAKNEAEAKLSSQTETALRDNYIAQAQAQKKAEEAIKMSGMTSGLSGSSLVDLYAKGAAARANILNSSNTAKNDIFSEYRNAIAESNAETNAALAEIDAQRKAGDEQNRLLNASKFAELLNAYNEEGSDVDSLDLKKAYEENYKSYLDPETDYDLISKYQGIIEDERAASKKSEYVYDVFEKYGEENGIKYMSSVLGEQGMADALTSAFGEAFAYGVISQVYSKEKAEELTKTTREQTQTESRIRMVNNGAIDILDEKVELSQFDIEKANIDSTLLLDAYKSAIENGDVKAGQICVISWSNAYEYLGNGLLKKTKLTDKNISKAFVPNGYEMTGAWNMRKKGKNEKN